MSIPTMRFVLASKKTIHMDVEFGPNQPKVSDGFGGWQVIDRPRKRGMTEWRGPAPQRLVVQCLFDGYPAGVTVTNAVKYLRAHFAPENGLIEPPPFSVHGVWPVSPAAQWVCDGLTYDDDPIIRQSDRAAMRALITLSLLQFVPGDVIITTSAARRAQAAAPGKSTAKTYVVRRGDTLASIAAKQLGDYRKASGLAAINKIRDPKHLTVGAKIRLS